MYYSASTGGFYADEIHGPRTVNGEPNPDSRIPLDAVEITIEEHADLLEGQSAGRMIVAGLDGKPALQDHPPPTPEELQRQYAQQVQAHMDSAARALGYEDIKSAATYADEPSVPAFQAEGQAFRAWRSLCWAYCYEALAAVEAGDRELPTPAELIDELPALVMPA